MVLACVALYVVSGTSLFFDKRDRVEGWVRDEIEVPSAVYSSIKGEIRGYSGVLFVFRKGRKQGSSRGIDDASNLVNGHCGGSVTYWEVKDENMLIVLLHKTTLLY